MEGQRIDSKLMLFTVVLVLITLLLLNYLFENNSKKGVWDYKETTTAASVMYQGEKVEDREVYYTVEQIIRDYINSYDAYGDDAFTYKDYYNYLSKEYKKNISKKEYEVKAEEFFNKLKIKYNTGYEMIDNTNILKDLYKLDNNVYVGKVQSDYSDSYGYIAIQFNQQSLDYQILWIE